MIQIRSDTEIENHQIVYLYDDNDNYLGDITSGLVLQDVCLQVKQQGIKGYYVVFAGEKTYFDENGRLFFKHKKPFTALMNIIRELI